MAENVSIIEELANRLDGRTEEGAEELPNPPYDAGPEGPEPEPKAAEPKAEPKVAPEITEPQSEPEPVESQKFEPSKQTVPYARFKEVVDERRESREQLGVLQSQIGELRGQLAAMTQAQTAKPIPDPNESPDDYIKYINEAHTSLTKKLADTEAEQKTSKEQGDHNAKIVAYAQEKIGEFIKQKPDYQTAFNHLQTAVIAERMDRGDSYSGGTTYFNNAIGAELTRLFQTGGDPAKMVYAFAKAYGYKEPNGAAPATKEPPKAPKIDKEAAQKANRSVATKGQDVETDLDKIDVDSMSHEQFLKFVDQQKRQSGKLPLF